MRRALLVVVALGWASWAPARGRLAAGKGEWAFEKGETSISRDVDVGGSWEDRAALSFRLRLSKDSVDLVHVLACVETTEGWWYQSARIWHLGTTRGEAVSVDVGPESGDWVPSGHLRPWDGYAARWVRKIRLKAFCNGGFKGSVIVEDVDLTPREGAAPRLRLLDFQAPARGRVGECCEIRFRLPYAFENPFDPDEVNIECAFVRLAGKTGYQRVPGFFHQRYFARWEGGSVRHVPVGLPDWRVRFWPREPGRYRCDIVVNTRKSYANVPWWIEVAPAGERKEASGWHPMPGELVIARDYDGHQAIQIMRSRRWRNDARRPTPGLVFAWRVPLEWTDRWGQDKEEWEERAGGYRGLGRYNLEVAARFDALLDESHAHGVSLPMALTCDEPFGERATFNWRDNPLRKENGGPLGAPSEFFLAAGPEGDSAAMKSFKTQCRYILARWGGHPAVSSWELWCTMPVNDAHKWHAKAGRFLADFRLGPKEIRSHHPQTSAPAATDLLNTFAADEVFTRRQWERHRAEVRERTRARMATELYAAARHRPELKARGSTWMRTWAREEAERRAKALVEDVSKHPTGKWKVDEAVERRVKHKIEAIDASPSPSIDGKGSMRLLTAYPGEAAIVRKVEADWHTYDRLAFDVRVPSDAPNDMRVLVFIRDADLWWYETLLPTYLRPGDWTKLLVDLSGETTRWEPRDHTKAFDRYALQRVRVLGVRIFGHRAYRGPVYIDNIALWRDAVARRRAQWVKVTESRPNALTVGRFEKFELTFRLSKTFANPFDPDCVELDGQFTSPSGKKITIPAFFYQDYERHLLKDGKGVPVGQRSPPAPGTREFLTPKGRCCWKVRFTPTEAGTYTYSVTLKNRKTGRHEPLAGIRGEKFSCVPSKRTGFVRRSKADPRYFELSTGQFFYPIGINLRSPSDNREPYRPLGYELPQGQGTFIYDEYYKKLAAAGVNWVRIWQCPWWCGLEWNREWPGFQGLGRYNVENAWRFDYLLDEAARKGIYVQVCLTNHGQAVIAKNIDAQWDENPLNARVKEGPAGPLHDASDFYTHETARKLFRQRLRYTVARWGYHPQLMAFTLFSEMEFTKAYWNDAGAAGDLRGRTSCPVVSNWVGEMAAHLKSIDPFGHLVTTHFSHPWRGADVWVRPELDYVQSNAYSGFASWHQVPGNRNFRPITSGMDHYYGGLMSRFSRPVLIAEYGGHWMRNPASVLNAELHAGTWATITTHMAGATGYWWWLHVHFTNQYSHYRAATRYMAGEDRRGQDLRHRTFSVASREGGLAARALRSRTHAYIWVYREGIERSLEPRRTYRGASFDLRDMDEGTYSVEFWNTYTGEVVKRASLPTRGGTLHIPLPEFENDIALKVKPAARR